MYELVGIFSMLEVFIENVSKHAAASTTVHRSFDPGNNWVASIIQTEFSPFARFESVGLLRKILFAEARPPQKRK